MTRQATNKPAAKKTTKAKAADKTTKISNDQAKAKVIEGIAGGLSLREICRKEGMPAPSTVVGWTTDDPVFSEQYARAREARADLMFDELDEVSADATRAETGVEVAGLRLKADNIKWKLARMAPKKYGDKVDVGLQNPDGTPLSLQVSFVTPNAG